MSLSEAADAILGTDDITKTNNPGGASATSGTYDTSPGAVAKNLLGKIY